MKNLSNNKPGIVKTSSLADELSRKYNENLHEEVVIYDECGDTLWDRVLRQENQSINPVQPQKPGKSTD